MGVGGKWRGVDLEIGDKEDYFGRVEEDLAVISFDFEDLLIFLLTSMPNYFNYFVIFVNEFKFSFDFMCLRRAVIPV